MTDAELKEALEAVAKAALPQANNNRFALMGRVKDVLSILANVTPEQYAEMHSALYPPTDNVVAALSDRMERFAHRLTADGLYTDASIVEAALHYVKHSEA
jgi:hypothetical protein